MKINLCISVCLATLVLASCAKETAPPAAAATTAAEAPVADAAPAAQPAAATEMVADTTGGTAAGMAADPAAAAADPTAVATTAAMTHDAEIGCAQCVYHLEGVTGCKPAVDMGGTIVMLEGGGVDPHGHCEKAHKAKLEGELKDGTFFATKVELIQG